MNVATSEVGRRRPPGRRTIERATLSCVSRTQLRARVLLLPVLATSACFEQGFIFVEPPPLGQAASAIVAVHTSAGIRASAHALSDDAFPIELEPSTPEDRPTALEVVLYPASLDSLELADGPLTPPSGEQLAVALPDGRVQVLVADIDDGEVSAWQSRPELSPDLAGFRFGAESPCRSFVADRVQIDASLVDEATRADVEFAMPLGSGAAVLSVSIGADSAMLRSEPGRLTRLSGCEGLVALSGYSAGENRFWLGGKFGALSLVSVDEANASCTIETSTVAPNDPGGAAARSSKLTGSPPDQAFELYLMTGRGRIWRFDGASWVLLFELSLHAADGAAYTQSGGLIWLGPQHILVSTGANEIREWRAGELGPAERLTGLGPDERIRTLTRLPDQRILAGVANGAIFERQAGSWARVNLVPNDPFVIQAFEGGWLALLTRGRVLQYDERFALTCPLTEIVGGVLRPRTMLVTPLGVCLPSVISSDPDTGRLAEVIWLE